MDDDWKREVKADLAEVRKDIKVLLEDVGRLKGVSALISGIVATVVAGAITAVLAFAISGCAPYPPANGNLPSLPSGAVVALTDENGMAYCTGTNTDRGLITAAHCVRDAVSGEVRVGTLWGLSADRAYWETTHPVRVLRVDERADIAVLERLPRRLAGTTTVRSEPARLGEAVYVVGHGMRIPYTYHAGHVGRAPAPCMPGWGCVAWFDIDLRISPGNSGSGVLDARGRLVGVVSFGVGPNIAGAIPAALIPPP